MGLESDTDQARGSGQAQAEHEQLQPPGLPSRAPWRRQADDRRCPMPRQARAPHCREKTSTAASNAACEGATRRPAPSEPACCLLPETKLAKHNLKPPVCSLSRRQPADHILEIFDTRRWGGDERGDRTGRGLATRAREALTYNPSTSGFTGKPALVLDRPGGIPQGYGLTSRRSVTEPRWVSSPPSYCATAPHFRMRGACLLCCGSLHGTRPTRRDV